MSHPKGHLASRLYGYFILWLPSPFAVNSGSVPVDISAALYQSFTLAINIFIVMTSKWGLWLVSNKSVAP